MHKEVLKASGGSPCHPLLPTTSRHYGGAKNKLDSIRWLYLSPPWVTTEKENTFQLSGWNELWHPPRITPPLE